MSKPQIAAGLSVAFGFIVAVSVASVILLTPHNQTREIVIIENQGGLCADGKVCYSKEVLYSDGKLLNETLNTNTYVSEKLKNQIIEEMSDIDFSLLAKSSEPDCPSYYDGQDIIYSFPEEPNQKFNICEYENSEDVKLFQLLKTLPNG